MIKLSRNEERIVLIIIIALLGIIAVFKFIVFKPDNVQVIKSENNAETPLESKATNNIKEPVKLYVYITGEINNPGLYVLKSGDRVADIISMAGGFTKEADITSVNLAEKLKDEEFINIAKKGGDQTLNSNIRNAVNGGKININIATAKEIDDFLPGIGEVYANNIVNYRDKNGRFKSIDEIARVEGIGSGKRFERIKDLITVN
jgi:competence protein ComEA